MYSLELQMILPLQSPNCKGLPLRMTAYDARTSGLIPRWHLQFGVRAWSDSSIGFLNGLQHRSRPVLLGQDEAFLAESDSANRLTTPLRNVVR